ncbi:hypothetical protein [Mucilaginibacter sp. OK283]|jgi:hypothetical protein|nr:hypothetical protein [Mucilaginibacter sp. OK283]SEP35552.1 hypothetical protein SAMN05428947_11244 [Mucilaginibacter sp. OK283]
MNPGSDKNFMKALSFMNGGALFIQEHFAHLNNHPQKHLQFIICTSEI